MRPGSRFATAIRFISIFCVLLPIMAEAGSFSAFGPVSLTRTAGPPNRLDRSFSILDTTAPYTIRVIRKAGGATATITLNGQKLYNPSDFRGLDEVRLEQPVTLALANSISIDLVGAPQGELSVEIIGIDNAPPIITAAASPPSHNNWHRTDVVVSFTCSDATAGIASCPAPVTVTTKGVDQPVSGTAIDRAGNSASTTIRLNIDKTPPTISASVFPAVVVDGWLKGKVRVLFTCGDTLSQVETCPDPFIVSETESLDGDIAGTVVDVAGNTASVSVRMKVDNEKPTVVPVLNGSQLVWTCVDHFSGVELSDCVGGVIQGPWGVPQVAVITATDRVGNSNSMSFSATDVAAMFPNTEEYREVVALALSGAGFRSDQVARALRDAYHADEVTALDILGKVYLGDNSVRAMGALCLTYPAARTVRLPMALPRMGAANNSAKHLCHGAYVAGGLRSAYGYSAQLVSEAMVPHFNLTAYFEGVFAAGTGLSLADIVAIATHAPSPYSVAQIETVPLYWAAYYAPRIRLDSAGPDFPMPAQEYYERAILPNFDFQTSKYLRPVPIIENNNPAALSGNVPVYFKIQGFGSGQMRIRYWWFLGHQRPCIDFSTSFDFLASTLPEAMRPYAADVAAWAPVMGEHSGDWENVIVITNQALTSIAAVQMYQHTGWLLRRDGDFERVPGTQHPIIYTGKKQHGSYWEAFGGSEIPGITCEYHEDSHNGQGAEFDASQKLLDLDSLQEAWMSADYGEIRQITDEHGVTTPTRVPAFPYWGTIENGVANATGVGTHPTTRGWDAESCKGEDTYGVNQAGAGCYQMLSFNVTAGHFPTYGTSCKYGDTRGLAADIPPHPVCYQNCPAGQEPREALGVPYCMETGVCAAEICIPQVCVFGICTPGYCYCSFRVDIPRARPSYPLRYVIPTGDAGLVSPY